MTKIQRKDKYTVPHISMIQDIFPENLAFYEKLPVILVIHSYWDYSSLRVFKYKMSVCGCIKYNY